MKTIVLAFLLGALMEQETPAQISGTVPISENLTSDFEKRYGELVSAMTASGCVKMSASAEMEERVIRITLQCHEWRKEKASG